ncbi:hypothetical protein [Sporosarcina sp. D27]|uniref:hypothetical protein n=1 Tax=Sporosarcina sp. D27 TaxID=1382305 RepID=UPI00046F7074|nr:hypothetical protein [Sporosarcina sp. D27]
MNEITQQIEQTGPAEYTVTLLKDGEEYGEEVFTRSNAVFPAYRTLINVLRDFEDKTVHVLTDSAPLAREFNNTPNPNATMLRQLNDVVARQGLTVIITHNNGN